MSDPAVDWSLTPVTTVALETPHGPAKAHLHRADRPRAALVLGHGAGGAVTAPDLVAATEAARSAAVSVALIEQPYRVAGRRSAPPARQLDTARTAAIEQLLAAELGELALVVGGRSSGARVACRTAESTGAIGVLCLAFPLQPPMRKSASSPPPSRLNELDEVTVPVLVVQGERDSFGMPPAGRSRTVTQVPGSHSLKKDSAAVAEAVRAWLPGVVGS